MIQSFLRTCQSNIRPRSNDSTIDIARRPRWRKFVITLSSATLTLTFTFSSSIMTAATVPLAKEFNVSTEVMILATSLFVLGFGIGPTFFGYEYHTYS